MKLEVHMSDESVKEVDIPEFERLNQQNFDQVLTILEKHKIKLTSITMMIEKNVNKTN